MNPQCSSPLTLPAGPLSWHAQISAHAAYVAQRRDAAAALADATTKPPGKRRSTERAMKNRAAILHALRDGKPHPFADLRVAAPTLTPNGIRYVCNQLKAEGLIDWKSLNRTNCAYQLTGGSRHEH